MWELSDDLRMRGCRWGSRQALWLPADDATSSGTGRRLPLERAHLPLSLSSAHPALWFVLHLPFEGVRRSYQGHGLQNSPGWSFHFHPQWNGPLVLVRTHHLITIQRWIEEAGQAMKPL